MKYYSGIEEAHSFDAYYKNVLFVNGALIIPYINLGISSHPLNPTENKLKYIDYSYVVFQNVNYLSVFVQSKRYMLIGEKEDMNSKFYFGGEYLDYDTHVFNDMHIMAENSHLILLNNSKLSDEMFIPHNTPNFPANMNKKEVETFYNSSLNIYNELKK